jgi:hypothetical protein
MHCYVLRFFEVKLNDFLIKKSFRPGPPEALAMHLTGAVCPTSSSLGVMAHVFRSTSQMMTWSRCYDFLNIFAEKFSKKLAFFNQIKAKI